MLVEQPEPASSRSEAESSLPDKDLPTGKTFSAGTNCSIIAMETSSAGAY